MAFFICDDLLAEGHSRCGSSCCSVGIIDSWGNGVALPESAEMMPSCREIGGISRPIQRLGASSAGWLGLGATLLSGTRLLDRDP